MGSGEGMKSAGAKGGLRLSWGGGEEEEDLRAGVLAVGLIFDVNTFFGLDRRAPTDWSLEALQRLLDRHEVSRALTYSLRGVAFDFVEGNNESVAAAARDERLVPVATVDPRRYVDCVEEVHRCLSEGLRVFRFFPDLQGWPLDGLHFLR